MAQRPPSEADNQPPARGTQDILRGLQAEPQRAWQEILAKVENKLRVLLHFRLQGRARSSFDPDDLLQEVWIEAMRKIDAFEYRGPGSLQRWMAQILRNKMMHASRSSGRLPTPASTLQGAADNSSCPGLFDALSRSQPGVSLGARRGEMVDKVRKVLDRLPAGEREVVLLKVYEGLTGKEIAQQLEIDESTVSVRFKRALESCARAMKELAP